jgi:hypothetical protein
MTRVMLGQGVVSVLLFTVHGHVRLIGGSRCHGWGGRGFPSCQRAPCVPWARRKYIEGVRRFDDVVGLGRGGNCRLRHLSCPIPLHKARAGWRLTFVPRATDILAAPLAGRFYWGPYDGALANAQGAIFYHLLGTLVF